MIFNQRGITAAKKQSVRGSILRSRVRVLSTVSKVLQFTQIKVLIYLYVNCEKNEKIGKRGRDRPSENTVNCQCTEFNQKIIIQKNSKKLKWIIRITIILCALIPVIQAPHCSLTLQCKFTFLVSNNNDHIEWESNPQHPSQQACQKSLVK